MLVACVEIMSRDRRIDGVAAAWSHEDAIAALSDTPRSPDVVRIGSNRKRDHPRPRLMATTRVDGVKAPQHRGTPSPHIVGHDDVPERHWCKRCT
jgi:hypothetical protein